MSDISDEAKKFPPEIIEIHLKPNQSALSKAVQQLRSEKLKGAQTSRERV